MRLSLAVFAQYGVIACVKALLRRRNVYDREIIDA